MRTNVHFSSYLAQFFLEWEMFQAEVIDKVKTNILCSRIHPLELVRPQMTVWCMHIACWIPVYTYTLRSCNMFCSSTATMVAQTCLIVTLYVHCPSCSLMIRSLYFCFLLGVGWAWVPWCCCHSWAYCTNPGW